MFFILDSAVKSVYLQIQQLIQKLAYGCSAFQFIHHQHYTKYNIRYRGYYVQQNLLYIQMQSYVQGRLTHTSSIYAHTQKNGNKWK